MKSRIRLVFDFEEKVVLPFFGHQLGQLYFVTGLKFDVFGVSNCTLNTNMIYGLPDGHWPGRKTANEVASMSQHALSANRRYDYICASARHLYLRTCDCKGQNKNQLILVYFTWRVLMRMRDSITLLLLIVGLIKNCLDGPFGAVKCKIMDGLEKYVVRPLLRCFVF